MGFVKDFIKIFKDLSKSSKNFQLGNSNQVILNFNFDAKQKYSNIVRNKIKS